jgi:hypothetical protein
LGGTEHTDCGELGADVEDHDDGHDEGDDVGEGGGALEDDGVRELDVTGVAVGFYPDAEVDVADAAHEGAERYGRIAADRVEVAEAHGARTERC